ncbi:MAG: hypothetical protein HOO91_17335 [Bacteroidales bacterium]|nr:hypothetical protein [Bacteroidales bacterium]
MNLAGRPNLQTLIPAKRVLVLAPHMDDEIIGCGGTIYKYAKNNIPVSVVYTTLSNKDLFNRIPASELNKIRVEEAKRSSKILGIQNSYYLNNDDSSDEQWHYDTSDILSILNSEKPDLVLLPFYSDSHNDHIKTNYLFKNCVLNGFSSNVAAYEVWSPMIMPSIIINITQEMELKLMAIREHKSQLKYLNYDRMCIGLNQYRSVFYPFPGINFAEAFYCDTAESYVNKFDFAKEKVHSI